MGKIIRKATIENVPFWILSAVSMVLIIAGFIVPPMGSIDGSVLKAVGELFAFAALWTVYLAISKGVDAKLTHGKTQIMLGDLKDDGQNEEIIEEDDV